MKSSSRITFLMLVLAASLISVRSMAQPGTLDLSFNATDIGFGFGDGASGVGPIETATLQSDGKVLIGGQFFSFNGVSRSRIARLNPDGSVDASFNPGNGATSTVRSIACQPDGKIIIVGDFGQFNGTPRNRIARLNPDGSLDATFNPGTGADLNVFLVALQPDGKMIISGDFNSYNGTARSRIARVNPDGSLDATFNPGTGVTGSNSVLRSQVLQPDGKVVIGGTFTAYNGTSRTNIARVNPDGSLDGTFNPGTGANSPVTVMALQPDGRVIIGGFFTTYNGTARNRIARVNSNGSLDASFNPGTGASSLLQSMVLQPDGKVVIGGQFTTYNGTARNRIARVNSNGSLDASFNPGTGTNNPVLSLTLQPDGKVIAAGSFSRYNATTRIQLARVNSDGGLDMTFNQGTGANGTVVSQYLQPDGKVIIVGNFTLYNGIQRNFIARVNPDGSGDLTFDPGTGADSGIAALAVQADGKVVIGGQFTTYDATPRAMIARINSNGSLDAAFNPGTGASSNVTGVAIQPDGKVIIVGLFTSYNGTGRNRIARVNPDGSLDATFNPGTGVNNAVMLLALQPDGKVIIAGSFATYNGTSRTRIARVNADGSLDPTFDPGTGPNNLVQSLALQPDGKVIIAGTFATYNGTPRNRIARLNSNGSLDATFDPGTGANSTISSVLLQPDGRMMIGGSFTAYNGTPRNFLARVNPDGALDIPFDPGLGPNNAVQSFALQPDGKAIIGGIFTGYGGIGRNRIARIHGDPDQDSDGVPDASDNCPSVSNPGQEDGDADGVGDVCDNCPEHANADQADADEDGVGNVCDAPLPPVYVVSPANNALNVPTNPTVSSIVLPGSSSYTIELSETSNFAVVAFTQTGPGNTKSFSGLKYNTKYYNRVKTNTTTGYGEVRSFTTVPASNLAFVTAPVNGAVNVPTVVSLSSNLVPGAASYTIELSETNDFSVVAFSSTGTTPVRPFYGLKYNQQYFNRVTTDLSEGAFGQVRSFTTMPATNLTVVTAPANGAVNVPTVVSLSTNLVVGAASYTIELSETNDFAVVAFTSTGATPVRPFYGLKYNQQYFNRVTTDVSGGAFGQVRSFTTMSAANLTVVTAPANGAVNVPTVVSLSTNLVVGAASYTIELSETNDFAVVAFTSTGATPVRPFFGLKYNQQYFNRVTTDVSGGAFGQVRSFTTQPATSVAFVSTPANNAVNVPVVVSIVSNLVVGASSYTIELSETNDFAVVAFTSTGASPVRPFYGLKYNQQYFNRVTTDLSAGLFGQVRSFTTQPASNVAFVNSPANNATGVSTALSVISNLVPGATSYTIELSQTSDFSVIDFTQTGPGPVLIFTGLSLATTYYNRVLTDLSGGVYGAVRSFTTKATVGGRFASPDVVMADEDEELADFELRLYSNPFRERLVVVVESKLHADAELHLMDMNGRTVHASLQKTNKEIEIAGASMASGLYLLRANAGTNIKTIRVVKLE